MTAIAAAAQGMAGVIARLAMSKPLHTPLASAVSATAKPAVHNTVPNARKNLPMIAPLLCRISGSSRGESVCDHLGKSLGIPFRLDSNTPATALLGRENSGEDERNGRTGPMGCHPHHHRRLSAT